MRIRLISSLAGGVIGYFLASPLQNALGVSEFVGASAAVIAGLAVGYVASMLFDVFNGSAPPGTTPQ